VGPGRDDVRRGDRRLDLAGTRHDSVQSRAVAPKYAEQYAAAAPNRKDLFEGTVKVHWTNGLLLGGKAGDANYSARKGDKVIQLAPGSSFDNL
jgi:hypothetical protein